MILRFGFMLGFAFALGGCSGPAPKLDKAVTVDCSGFAGWTEIEAFLDQTSCGHPDAEGVLHISQETMRFFGPEDFNHGHSYGWQPQGLWCLTFRLSDGSGGFGYLAPDGRARISNYPYDNNCQPFRNDVAISYVDGKVVFFDANLDVVKQTEYVLANPFYKHLAMVCDILPEKEYHGEHFQWRGGRCGYIDAAFNIVVPIITAYEETKRLTGGKYDGVELDQWDAPVLAFLVSHLEENARPVEAVFRPEGCLLKYCSDQKKKALNLPAGLAEDKTWVKIIRFRLADQTLFEGQVLHDRNRNLTLHALQPIASLQTE